MLAERASRSSAAGASRSSPGTTISRRDDPRRHRLRASASSCRRRRDRRRSFASRRSTPGRRGWRGFPASLADSLQEMGFVVRVPLATVSGIATFHAVWRDPLSDDEASAAAELLRTLTQLTSIAERSLREGEQHKLALDSRRRAPTGSSSSREGQPRRTPRRRALLAIPEDIEFSADLFNPRTLDGEPVRPAAGAREEPLPDPRHGARRPRARARREPLPGAERMR